VEEEVPLLWGKRKGGRKKKKGEERERSFLLMRKRGEKHVQLMLDIYQARKGGQHRKERRESEEGEKRKWGGRPDSPRS